MRKVFFSAIFLILCLTFAAAKDKTTVAVVSSSSVASVDVTSYLTETLIDTLIGSKKYTVVERSALKTVMQELSLQQNDEFDESKAGEIGKLLGAKIIFVVKINRIAKKFYVTISGVSTTTGEVIILKKYTVKNEKKFVKSSKIISRQFVAYANKYVVM